MENKSIFENICSNFIYDDKENYLKYNGKGNNYKNLLFNFLFLKEKGQIKFKSVDELWLIKEFKTEEEKDLNLNIIKCIISYIENNKTEFPVDLVKKFINLKDQETFEIFKYLQSIYSNFSNNPSFIIYSLAYSIGFNKPHIQICLKKDFKEIISPIVEKFSEFDNIEYNKINKNFIKCFNGLLSSNEKKKDCYDYLCNFNKNVSNSKELIFDESFSYFSGLKEIIIDTEKKYNEKIKNIKEDTENEKNSKSDTSEKTGNNNSSDKNGSSNGENDNSFDREKPKNIIIGKNENDTSKKGEKMHISNNEKTITHAINKTEIKEISSEEKKEVSKNKENKGDNDNELMTKINKMIDEKISKINKIHEEKMAETNKIHEEKIAKISKMHEEKMAETNRMHEEKMAETNRMHGEKMEKQFLSFVDISTKITLLNSLLMKISFIINTSKLKKESIEKYYDLKKRNIDYKLLIDKLSSTIYILQNANIINLKRKLVECLLFEIFTKYEQDIILDEKYFPSQYHLNKLSQIIKEALDKYKQKEKSNRCDKCSEKDKCEKCAKLDILYKSKKNEINDDIEKVKKMKEDVGLSNFEANFDVKDDAKQFNKLLAVIEFLKFCKKNLHPFVHGEGENINYYLLTNSLFTPGIKNADILLSLNDMIETNKIKDDDIKIQLEELNLNDDLNLYVPNKIISNKEAVKILLNPQKFSINEKHYSTKFNEIKIKLNRDLSIFNECYNSFFKGDFIGNLIGKNIDFSKNEFEENDLSELLNDYKEKMKTILKKDIKLTEAIQTIKSIISKINEEAEKAQRFIINIGNTDRDAENLKKEVISHLNRIYLILKFVEEQNIEFSNFQKQIYEEFENSSNAILKQSECLKNLLESAAFVEKENLLEKWFKSKLNPRIKKEDLTYTNMKNNIQDLIISVRMDLKYTYEDKFVLWMVKNGFSKYLKNDF